MHRLATVTLLTLVSASATAEPRYAAHVPVLSSASAYRYEEDVPILVPGVNMAAHLPLVEHQRHREGLPLPGLAEDRPFRVAGDARHAGHRLARGGLPLLRRELEAGHQAGSR